MRDAGSDDQASYQAALVASGRKPKEFKPRLVPTIPGVTVYASGASGPSDLMALSKTGFDVGISAAKWAFGIKEVSRVLAETSHVKLFVDSGAFSEVSFGPDGPSWPDPITHDRWLDILEIYDGLAEQFGKRLLFVGPDKVGSQAGTMKRIRRYAADIKRIAETGARPMYALQPGPLPAAQFFDEILEVVGPCFVVGIPSVDAATPTRAVEEFLKARGKYIPQIHFLGLGPTNPRVDELFRLVKKYAPQAQISQDAVIHRVLIGKDGPRPITGGQMIADDQIDARFPTGDAQYAESWQPKIGFAVVGDWTEEAGGYERELSEKRRYEIAIDAGYDAAAAKVYARDPDEFYEGWPEAADSPWLNDLLRGDWAEQANKKLRSARRMRSFEYGIRRTSRPLKAASSQGRFF
jgi:hypothetical protein